MTNYHNSTNLHQSPFLASPQMFPGFVEPPPPYGAASAPVLNPSHLAPSVGLISNSRGANASSTSAAFAEGEHSQQIHLGNDKFHSSAEQQQQQTTTNNSSTIASSNSSSGGAQQQQFFQPQMPSAQQTLHTATLETPVFPPGAVPIAMHPPPAAVHSVYPSQNIPIGHSFSIGGPNVPNQTQIVKMIIAVPLGPHEMQLDCSNCRQSVRTRAIRRPGLLTWIICGALALVGCWPCCVLPFCAQSCQDVEHYCSNCNVFIGKYSRI